LKVGAIERIFYELYLSWRFVKGDLSATIVPTTLFTIAAWHSQAGSFQELVAALGWGLLYFWLYVFTFCLSNQLEGIDEDRLNKPSRPLVTGLVSPYGAFVRWAFLMPVFTLLGWWLGVVEWTVLWQAALVLHNFCGWAKHWFGKHLLMGVGIVAGLAPAWELVAPLTPSAWRWIVFLASIILPLIAAQDLRDIAGDRANGRKTFPIVFGEVPTRVMLSVSFALLPLAVHWMLLAPAISIWSMIVCNLVLTSLSLWIATRIMLCRSCQADHRSYTLFTYWYCCVMLSAIVIL
jgi:4-hydroxybenzoate polyprenyltransferase